MKIPFNDLNRINKDFLPLLKQASEDVLNSGWFINGKNCNIFENEFANYCGSKYAIGVATGQDALELSLRAIDVKNREVIIVANAGGYSLTAAVRALAIPVFADVDPVTHNICKKHVAKLLNNNTKAIIVTHLYGRMADIEDIVALVKSSAYPDIKIIEDCAQAHGACRANLPDKKVGTFADIGAFSFYPTKNLGAIGDAGAVITSDENLRDRLLKLKQYGWSDKYQINVAYATNSRLDEIQAAFLTIKLQYLDKQNQERREIAKIYFEELSDFLQFNFIDNCEFVSHLLVAKHEDRDKIVKFLRSKDIGVDIHYPIADYNQKIVKENLIHCINGASQLPNTDLLTSQIFSLPCFPGLQEEEVFYITKVLKQYFN